MIRNSIEYAAWLVIQVTGEAYVLHYPLAFFWTLMLQAFRKQLAPRRYLIFWRVLLVITLVWGGWGLLRYLPEWADWYEAYFFLPCLVAAVGLAMLHERLPGRVYWPMLGAIVLIIVAAYWVMAPYRTPAMRHMKVNPWSRPPVTAEIRHSLTGKGWGEWTRNGDIRWEFVDSWGVVFLAGVVAVRPRRERVGGGEVVDVKG